jgi:lipoprotein signal peptidase
VIRSRRLIVGAATGLAVLLADQASKDYVLNRLDLQSAHSIAILPVLNFTFVMNHGITFGLNDHVGASVAIPTVAALVVVAVLLVWLWRAERGMVVAGLGAICGGATGNVIDRLRFGAVVDFIDAHAFGWSWYVFNVADAAIVCGVAALVLDSLRPPRLADHPSGG